MALHFLVESAGDAAVGGLVSLTGAEAKHAAVVRRLRVGEAVTVGDGRGIWLTGVAEEVSPSRVDVRIAERVEHEPASPRLVLVQALAKGDRDELAVQAATELGVDAVVPWQAARSVSIWKGPKAEKGRARWQAIVREASKQAIRPRVPDVEPIATTRELVACAAAAGTTVLVLEPTATDPLSALTASDLGADVLLVVGPEGGVAPDELAALTAAGARPVLLGDTVLRTSTAGPAALAVLSTTLGRW